MARIEVEAGTYDRVIFPTEAKAPDGDPQRTSMGLAQKPARGSYHGRDNYHGHGNKPDCSTRCRPCQPASYERERSGNT
jgi:hypothetical protein